MITASYIIVGISYLLSIVLYINTLNQKLSTFIITVLFNSICYYVMLEVFHWYSFVVYSTSLGMLFVGVLYIYFKVKHPELLKMYLKTVKDIQDIDLDDFKL